MSRLMRRFGRALALALAVFQVSLCSIAAATALKVSNAAASGPQPSGVMRSITLPHFEPELPAAPGRSDFLVVCVSCHSPRYVSMQPLLSQRQWEESVDKMAKTYGAQMDQEQRKSILGYLVATRGPGAGTNVPPAADDDFASAQKLAPRPQSVVSLKLASDANDQAAELSHGAELYTHDCAACHGPNGRGDGMVGQVLLRRPKNLAATRFSLRLLSEVLWNGKPGTAMPSWRGLPHRDLAALAAYVQSLQPAPAPSKASPEILQPGKQVFLQNCAPCHGASGDGKGAAGASLLPEPANFKLKQPDFDYLLQVLRDGIPGTAMPAWKDQIPEADRRALAYFVRSLFEPPALSDR